MPRSYSLKYKNTAVITTEIPLTNARIAINEILYKQDTGLVDISVDIKSYTKPVYGATNPQYQAISGIKFIGHN